VKSMYSVSVIVICNTSFAKKQSASILY
jgi:hypothetical protein